MSKEAANRAANGGTKSPMNEISITPSSASSGHTTPTSSFSACSYEYPGSSPESEVSMQSTTAEVLMYPGSSHHVAQKTVGAGDKNERTVYVDMSQGDLPTDFVDRVSKCVLYMQVRYESSADDFEIADGFGQASVVVAHDGVPRFVTAKHVLKQYQDADTVKYDVSRISIGLPNNLQKRCVVDFTDENHVRDAEPLIPLRDGKTWKGIDIGWGSDFTLEALGEAKYNFFAEGKYSIEQFELPRRNGFRIMQGQKIGIAVFNKYKISTECPAVAKSDYPKTPEEQLEQIFGKPGFVTIYTGEISFVGEYHIEYGLNTYNGSSGAMVFLLNVPEQHFSVDKDDCGKAIAVHAGFQNKLGTNVGFMFEGLGS